MLSRLLLRRRITVPSKGQARCVQRRWNSPAPRPGDGPLMSRRADRELPEIKPSHWRKTFPIFLGIVAVSTVAILNYQTAASPVVTATLFALRTSPKARALLGDEVYFKSQMPWIRGEINQLAGRIDITFSVRGTRGNAVMRFVSSRASSRGVWETSEWSLRREDGEVVDLLEGGVADPFAGLLNKDEEPLDLDDEDEFVTKGFRQQGGLNR